MASSRRLDAEIEASLVNKKHTRQRRLVVTYDTSTLTDRQIDELEMAAVAQAEGGESYRPVGVTTKRE